MARSLKFGIKEEDQVYHPCSENKGADQSRGYREADLRLCFHICRLLVFSSTGSYLNIIKLGTESSTFAHFLDLARFTFFVKMLVSVI